MIFKLQPLFFVKVWGGNKIRERFGYDCQNATGEAWGISGHKDGSTIVENGIYKGTTIRDLYDEHKYLFGYHPSPEFPILLKIIDAKDDLSVQVHPDNTYARLHEQSLGKTECWYILEAEKNAEIIIGHNAHDKQEFYERLENNEWDKLLNHIPIHNEELYCIYSGTVHAIGKGTLLLEIQQSSDITYRLYDYNRPDNGVKRELQITKAMDVILFPGNVIRKDIPKDIFDFLIVSNKFSLSHTSDLYGDYLFIIEGNGEIDDIKIKSGDFLMITSSTKYTMTGDFKYCLVNIKTPESV